jgi:hypothetical protein
MKIPKGFALMAVALLPLIAGFSQTVNPSTAPPPKPAAILPSSADEVVRLAQSGMGDQVVLAFIGQSHAYYNLSGADITALNGAGVSS